MEVLATVTRRQIPVDGAQVVLRRRPVPREVGLGINPQRRLVAGNGAAEVFIAIAG